MNKNNEFSGMIRLIRNSSKRAVACNVWHVMRNIARKYEGTNLPDLYIAQKTTAD